MTREEGNDFYNNLTDKQRREMYSLNENEGCNSIFAVLGCLFFAAIIIFFILSSLSVYDAHGNFVKWIWQ